MEIVFLLKVSGWRNSIIVNNFLLKDDPIPIMIQVLLYTLSHCDMNTSVNILLFR